MTLNLPGKPYLALSGTTCRICYPVEFATYTRMYRRGDRTNGGQLNCWCPTRLLQLSTSWYHYLEHQQNPTCHQHAGSSGHRHWKMRSHNTGLGETTLAPSPVVHPVAHHLQSHSHNLTKHFFQKKRIISRSCCPSKLRQECSDRVLQIVYTLVFPGLFSQVAPFVLQRRKFGTVFQTTWPTFLCHWYIPKSDLNNCTSHIFYSIFYLDTTFFLVEHNSRVTLDTDFCHQQVFVQDPLYYIIP